MSEYQTMYFQLFNAVTDALTQLEAMNIGSAKMMLIEAQQKTEEFSISHSEPSESNLQKLS